LLTLKRSIVYRARIAVLACIRAMKGFLQQCDWMGESPPNIRANKGGVRAYRQRMMDGMLEGAKGRGNGMNHDSVMWRSEGFLSESIFSSVQQGRRSSKAGV